MFLKTLGRVVLFTVFNSHIVCSSSAPSIWSDFDDKFYLKGYTIVVVPLSPNQDRSWGGPISIAEKLKFW